MAAANLNLKYLYSAVRYETGKSAVHSYKVRYVNCEVRYVNCEKGFIWKSILNTNPSWWCGPNITLGTVISCYGVQHEAHADKAK